MCARKPLLDRLARDREPLFDRLIMNRDPLLDRCLYLREVLFNRLVSWVYQCDRTYGTRMAIALSGLTSSRGEFVYDPEVRPIGRRNQLMSEHSLTSYPLRPLKDRDSQSIVG